MIKKPAKSITDSTATNGSIPKQDKTSARSKPKISGKKNSKAPNRKALGRKEKLEAVRKANQAMMKAWELISQRTNGKEDAQDNI